MNVPPQQTSTRPTFVLVHGGFLGAWIWTEVVAALEDAGFPALSLDLPSVQAEPGAPVGDLYDDARAVRELLAAARTPVVLCGHSAGGVVITEAAAGTPTPIRRLVYLTAVVPDVGQSMSAIPTSSDDTATATADDVGDDQKPEPVTFRDDGLIELDRELATHTLFNDCSPARAASAVTMLRPMNPAIAGQPVTGAAWREHPSTLVRGTRDRLPEAIAPTFLAHAPEIIELPAGHCPNWSRPKQVAHLLVTAASA